MGEQAAQHTRLRRWAWLLAALLALTAVVYLMATAKTGPVDPAEQPQSHTSAVFNSAAIVFREGLEAVLILAAVTASFLGANRPRRRLVFGGAAVAFAAAFLTWWIFDLVIDAASPLGPRLEAITGLLAVIVLVIVLNWFFHRVYWTGWIAHHHRRRKRLLGSAGLAATVGLVALGFTSVYREGFEVVLFLQAVKLKAGPAVVAEGVAFGLAGTAVVGVLTFVLHQRLPYRRMLIATGAMVGFVLVVMIGGTALAFQDLGWLPRTPTPFSIPEWMGSWFELYPTWETLGVQAVAAALVLGSYFLAEYLRVKRPRRRGEAAARPAERPPLVAEPAVE